jgi:hypothetical protein
LFVWFICRDKSIPIIAPAVNLLHPLETSLKT